MIKKLKFCQGFNNFPNVFRCRNKERIVLHILTPKYAYQLTTMQVKVLSEGGFNIFSRPLFKILNLQFLFYILFEMITQVRNVKERSFANAVKEIRLVKQLDGLCKRVVDGGRCYLLALRLERRNLYILV